MDLRPALSAAAVSVALAFAVLAAPAVATAQPITLQDGFAPLVARVAPAVVNIRTDRGSVGSGVIISSDGLVVTNYHVVARSARVQIALADHKLVAAQRLGFDRENDLALLKLPAGTYPSIPWADSAAVRVGEFAIAIGNPLNLGTSVSVGIVSAIGRGSREADRYEDFIQTDAAVNPGNSGGALINARGQLMGINTMISSRSGGNEGIAFAISSNLTRGVVEQLVKRGATLRGFLGIVVIETTDGVMVYDLASRGPAARAGLRPGDILLEIGGKRVSDAQAFTRLVSQTTPNTKTPIKILRRGRSMTIEASVGARPDE